MIVVLSVVCVVPNSTLVYINLSYLFIMVDLSIIFVVVSVPGNGGNVGKQCGGSRWGRTSTTSAAIIIVMNISSKWTFRLLTCLVCSGRAMVPETSWWSSSSGDFGCSTGGWRLGPSSANGYLETRLVTVAQKGRK